MFFGNSRVTIKKSENCDFYGITDKSFAVSFITGWVKDDVFFAYTKSCLGFEGWQAIIDLNYLCLNNEFCGGLSAPPEATPGQGLACDEIVGSLTASDVYIIENSFDNFGMTPTISPFCTSEVGYHLSDNDCQCPTGYIKSEEYYGETCFKIFPIETIGLNSTDEIDPCKFLLIAKQLGGQAVLDMILTEFQDTTVSVYYKTYNENGTEVCNVATFQIKPDPCYDLAINCWPPPGADFPLILSPDRGVLVSACDYCEEYRAFPGSDALPICEFEGLAIASSTCKCPYTLTCYSEDWAGGSSGNCFFAPGITTTEPCINGSWNGASCADGYNDVCASTDCVDKICKELDWFIQNYASYTGDDNWWGYASIVTDQETLGSITGTHEEFFVSCGPTGVSAFDDLDYLNVTFGETASQRQWGRIVGLLNFWTKESGIYTGVVFDANGALPDHQKNLPLTESFGGTSCGWFYPMNLCCPLVPRGAFDYDCPMCGPSGFTTHSPDETSCCCATNMIPIVFGLNDQVGYDSAATGISSIGIQPSISLKG